MRWLGVSTGFALAAAVMTAHAGAWQQSPVDQRATDLALRMAAQLAAETKNDVGSLSREGVDAFLRWETAARDWQKERDAGAGPALARGVLYDCVSRLKGVLMPRLKSEDEGSSENSFAMRPARAADAFEKALVADPALIEAKVRLARLRALKNRADAVPLETLAAGAADAPFPYLASMFRADSFQASGDFDHAAEWYRKAASLNPKSSAAAIALAALVPGAAPAFAQQGADPYYVYPCTVMTKSVANALATRVAKLKAGK